MSTGFECNENPIANGSEHWNEAKIIKFSSTEYRVVTYNRSQRRKTDKTATVASERRLPSDPTEEQKDEKVRKNKKTVYGYLMANDWEYTVVFKSTKSPSALSECIRLYYKNRGYKAQYIHIPIDDGLVGVVSGVPANVLEIMQYCDCVVPFSSKHAQKLRNCVQYRQGERGFFASQKLSSPEEKIIKNPRCYTGEITTSSFAVSTFRSEEEAMYFIEKGERMKKSHEERFKEFQSKVKNCLKSKQYNNIALNLIREENLKIGLPEDADLRFLDRIIEEKSLNIIGAPKKKEEEDIFTVFCTRNGYILKTEIYIDPTQNSGEKGIDYSIESTIPVLYIIGRKRDNAIFYVGCTYSPLNRYFWHFIGDKNKMDDEWGTPVIKAKKESDSKFYNFVINNKLSFDDFYITFVPLNAYMNESGEIKHDFLYDRHNVITESGNYLRNIEKAEAYLQTLLLQMEKDKLICIYRNGNGETFFEEDKKRVERTKQYEDLMKNKNISLGKDPVSVGVGHANDNGGFGLIEMYNECKKREMDFYERYYCNLPETKNKCLSFAEMVWERKAEVLGIKTSEAK